MIEIEIWVIEINLKDRAMYRKDEGNNSVKKEMAYEMGDAERQAQVQIEMQPVVAQFSHGDYPINQKQINVFSNTYGGVADGFGPNYYNVRDPNFQGKNMPVKINSSFHIPILIFNIIFLSCLVVGLIGYDNFIPLWAFILMVVLSYLFYLCVSCNCSQIKEYLDNFRKFDTYQETYNKMTAGKGYFRFHIECYHNVSSGTGKHRRTRRVVTHTATQNYMCRQSIDESGELMPIFDIKHYVFLQYLKRYYFSDEESERKFKKDFDAFVARNTRDVHQSYSHTFELQGYEEHVGYSALGQASKSKVLFIVLTLLGLALPFSWIFECSVARYDIGILKRFTV